MDPICSRASGSGFVASSSGVVFNGVPSNGSGFDASYGVTGSNHILLASGGYLSLMANVAPAESLKPASISNFSCNEMRHFPMHVHEGKSVHEVVGGTSVQSLAIGNDEDRFDSVPDDEACYGDYDGDVSESSVDDHVTPRILHDFTVGYSAEDAPLQRIPSEASPIFRPHKEPDVIDNRIPSWNALEGSNVDDVSVSRLAKWGSSSPFAHNEMVIGAVEKALRAGNDGQKKHMFLPTVGQTFPSLNDAYQFYNLYSCEMGFSIRSSKSNEGGAKEPNGSKQRIMQEWSCQQAHTPRKGTVHSSTMCGCPARLRVLRNKNGEYYISIFVPDHNHDLVESCGEKRHLHSHQSIDQATKDMVRYLRENNVSLSKVRCILGSMNGSVDNLTFNKKRLKTVCSDIASELISDDMQKIFQTFMKMREEDPNFVYAWQIDLECRITALMWSSGNNWKMYSYFGDVVTFDTTYRTNLYKMPFGIFVGVNNHFKSVIFADVLLTSEETASFEWAYTAFVEMMGGKAPATMLTDQCAAMGAALRNVLKTTVHRWCKWHVLKKVVEVLGHMFSNHNDFRDEFNKVVNHMLTQDEFNQAWDAMLEKYGLQGHPELSRAFESRKLWAKAWFTDVFCAGMTSTQRSESANNVMKNLVPCNSPLNLFVHQYSQVVKEQEIADQDEEKKNKQQVIKPKFGWLIERHAADVYTRAVHELIPEELHKTTAYVLQVVEPGVFRAVHVQSQRREKWSKVEFQVSIDEKTSYYSCECGLFNHSGILCCHVLLVMVQTGAPGIPDVHIMKRWTRQARTGNAEHLLPAQETSGPMQSKLFRHNILESAAKEVVKLAESDTDDFDYALKQLVLVQKKLKERQNAARIICQVGYESSGSEVGVSRQISSAGGSSSDGENRSMQIVDSRTGVAIDLSSIKAPIVQCDPFRPSSKRWKSAKELRIQNGKIRKERRKKQAAAGSGPVKQSRHCRQCRSIYHNIRQCPELQPLSPIDDEDEQDL